MRPSLPPSLGDLLAYLGEIGYGDLYVRPRETSRPAPAPDLVAPRAMPGSVVREAPPPPLSRSGGESRVEGEWDRSAELAAFAQTVSGCTRCRLCEGRRTVVFGSGNPDADLMLIGEGPGAEEDRQGLPFVGPAGELLTRILQAIDLRREDVYIANVVKCRPPGNRDPQPDEVAACRGYLERQIALVQPRVLVALGRVSAQTLLGTESPIGQMRGRWHQVKGISTMVTYHPAALLRNSALKRPTWEDMQQVRDRLRAG